MTIYVTISYKDNRNYKWKSECKWYCRLSLPIKINGKLFDNDVSNFIISSNSPWWLFLNQSHINSDEFCKKRDGWDAISAEVCTSKLGSKFLCFPYWDCILIYVSRCKELDLFGDRSGLMVSLLLPSISLSLKWLHWYFLTEICGRILGEKVVMNFKGWNTVQKGA